MCDLALTSGLVDQSLVFKDAQICQRRSAGQRVGGMRRSDLAGRNRFEHLRPGDVAGDWYADYPDHYAGDATAASGEKGLKLLELQVDALADYIRAVKNDEVVAGVLDEFYTRCEDLGK